ncbi:MAG: glycosyltransferase [Clostridia bacterium]|nr:glycosyltransferase [Clostridia bacterium]
MIRVLQILTDSNIGGAGRLLVNYLHNFDTSAFEMLVVLPKGAELIPLVEAEGYPVRQIENGRDRSFDMGAVGELKTIIREWKPDIVHCHSSFSGKLAAWLCRVPGRFYTRHCAFPQPKKLTTFPGKQINGFVNNTLSTHIVAVAQAAMDDLTATGVDPKKITVIINGVEPMRTIPEEEKTALRASLGIGETDFVCGISARLEDYKGHTYLLQAAAKLKAGHPRLRYLIIGGGSMEETLKAEADQLGITDIVRFTGFVYDVAPFYNIMHLSVNCSIGTETSCLALSEGYSLGIPAAASDFGGNPYMVTDHWNGFLVPQRNPDALAEKIAMIADDPVLYEKLRKGAAESYEKKFTAAAMTRQMEALYHQAVKKA